MQALGKTAEPVFPPKSILAPVDFSETSSAGLEAAKMLAAVLRARLKLIHVNESAPAYLCQNMGTAREKSGFDEYLTGLQRRLEDQIRGFPRSEALVDEGDAKEVLGRMAAEGRGDWVVMGTHGYGGIKHFLLGSTAEAVIYGTAVPVLTVHSAPRPGWPSRVLMPVQFTQDSDKALLYGLKLAEGFKAAVTLLHVVEDGNEGGGEAEALEGHIERLIGRDRFARLDWRVEAGHAAETILKRTEASCCDLVVMAAHRRRFWNGIAIGATSEKVLRHCEAPVLIVPTTEVAKLEEEARVLGASRTWSYRRLPSVI